ncbi:hypothetical protein EJ110_NYTH00645, partial [Nymphaea thermarum]
DPSQRIDYEELEEGELTPETPGRPEQRPNWLEEFLDAQFFRTCVAHQRPRDQNETNIFCIECVRRICHHCLPHHALHDTLPVWKYESHNVVHLRDIQKHLDCCRVQSCSTNGFKAVFLNPRPPPENPNPLGSKCIKCGRSMETPYPYCSIACMVSKSTASAPPAEKEGSDVKCEEAPKEVEVRPRKSRRKGIPVRAALKCYISLKLGDP